jgi:precorrin-6Y C5,15-methyltransferase (decarboxylating)
VIHVIGIGFRPLDREAKKAILNSDVVLSNQRLLEVFKKYDEYIRVKDRIIIHDNVYDTLDYIDKNFKEKTISLLAAGDPMFFGIGRLIVERFGKDDVIIYPDLSSIQVAFSRIKETSNNALLISLHGGPDPEKRRRPEYELNEIPSLLKTHEKIAILTDRENNPSRIAEEIASSTDIPVIIYVCERLGYDDEKIYSGTPEEIASMSFEDPNVVIIKRDEERGS